MNFQPSKTLDAGFYTQRLNQAHEASSIVGYPIYYLQSDNIETDEIFGEATKRNFLAQNSHEMYCFRDEDTNFGGNEVFGGFGYTPTYNDIRYVPVKWFTDLSIEPIEGDLIYDQDYEILFEITKVGTLTETHTGDVINNTLINYKLFLKQYVKGNDTFDTGIDTSIDELEADTIIDNYNDDLTTDLENLDVRDSVTRTNPFGNLE